MTSPSGDERWPLSSDAPGTFVACAVHELRAPVAGQRALVEVALADPYADVEALREMGMRVIASCVRQQRLLDGLLALARSQRRLTRREPVDLAAITADVLESHDCRGLARTTAFAPAWTIGDARLVERLVANLVSNGVRHNVPGGRLELATVTRAGRAQLTVVNTGPPIGLRELARAFRPFERLDAAAAGGLGLGLTVVQAIADAHDALLDASARPGGGLRVEVAFPGWSPHHRRAGEPARPAAPESGDPSFPHGLSTVEIDRECDAAGCREQNLWIHHIV